ncbi:hypothetical protein BDQ12DRAFT_626255 [Crucibulum laeve]|uniref:DH domain-containing protein n=1 Tax=Crucibulum laeve TaxID=68775 RepID=A0A5C3M888_9AGAR|nr:hypothetical protein BDQ12DRAFT_626255 [Crucibulum laeve]
MNTFTQPSKPLPPPVGDSKLPPPPPPDFRDSIVVSPPPPPPKFSQSSPASDSPQFLSFPSSTSLDAGLSVPLTPTTPTTPTSPSSSDVKPKKSNPLADLIDTEKLYVDELTGIIRKVAAAWSRSNLPPPDLDTMFRSIEGIYKANRGLHTKLKEIGANPSSPKALGDLLMRWIDDLEAPYTAYCAKYRCGFDSWEPVQSNARLPSILSNFSAAIPPPSAECHVWTLDTLFLLPKARLKYYRKLYSRLLKSTAPGRSDHRLLVGALETLDRLLDTLDHRSSIKVGSTVSLSESPTAPDTEDEVVVDMRTQTLSTTPKPVNSPQSPQFEATTVSDTGSGCDSSISGGERLSRETATTSISRGSNATLSMPISDLERRLSTQRTLDIFTMKPKAVKLQMNPPSLTFTREMRLSLDVTIRFTPRATGTEVVHRQGHIFLLSDLFLVCERMSPDEQAQYGSDGAEMWLCYPPLAGKVLRISDVEGQDNVIQVAIMRKEFLNIQAESVDVRNKMFTQFKECIEFSGTLPPPSKQSPPPVPSLNAIARPMQGGPASTVTQPQPLLHQPPPSYQNDDGKIGFNASRRNMSPDGISSGPQRMGSIQGIEPLPLGPPSNTSTPPYTPGPPTPFGSGQVIPPTRSTSVGGLSGSGPSSGAAPGYNLNMNGTYPQAFNSVPPNRAVQSSSNSVYSPPHPQQQPLPQNNIRQSPYGLPPGSSTATSLPTRPPSEPSSVHSGMRNSPSTRSLSSQYSQYESAVPAPPLPPFHGSIPRSSSYGNLHAPQPRTLLPSAQFNARSVSLAEPSFHEPSPPGSPVDETPQQLGPVTSTVSANMKCKVFLQQHHAQWKSFGSAKLKLYRQDPTNVKQLVVEADNKDKSILISTIVLTDGVERVGKTGVAIELSDKGARTGVIYMIQLRNEKSAGGLFDSLLAGSDRAARG